MAVFPDRIGLKHSTDAQATIETAIGSGGTDEIQQGELVVGREVGSARLYTVDAVGSIVTISGAPGGGASIRSTVTHTTASLADGASADATFSSTGKSGQFIKVTTDRAAWVTLYNTIAARTADASRLITVDPATGSGVVLEVITTAAETIQVTPTAGYYNDESTPSSELYAKIVNKSGATSTVQVDIALLPLEP